MCELLIMVKDNELHPDPTKAAMQYRPGMVVTIQEDGHAWGPGELEDHVKIIKLPGIKADQLSLLMSGRPAEDKGLGAPPMPAGIRYWRARSYDLALEHPGTSNLVDWVEAHFVRHEHP